MLLGTTKKGSNCFKIFKESDIFKQGSYAVEKYLKGCKKL